MSVWACFVSTLMAFFINVLLNSHCSLWVVQRCIHLIAERCSPRGTCFCNSWCHWYQTLGHNSEEISQFLLEIVWSLIWKLKIANHELFGSSLSGFHFTNWSIFSQAGPLSKVVRFDQPPCKMILRCKSLKSFGWSDFWHPSDGLNYSAVWVPEPARYWVNNFLICIFLGSWSAP